LLFSLAKQTVDAGLGDDVRADEVAGDPGLFELGESPFGTFLIIAVIENDLGISPTERKGDGLAESGGTARHHCHMSRQQKRH